MLNKFQILKSTGDGLCIKYDYMDHEISVYCQLNQENMQFIPQEIRVYQNRVKDVTDIFCNVIFTNSPRTDNITAYIPYSDSMFDLIKRIIRCRKAVRTEL